ncbi:MAG: amidase family protein [Phycisphaerales bacterium]
MVDMPWQGDACSLVEEFRAKGRSPREELDATLAAVDRSELNAFSFVDPALAQAKADAADVSLPFGGVPFGVKELSRYQGWPDTDACLVFQDRIATTTETGIRRAEELGGVVPFGLTTASEFGGLNVSVTKLNGVTHNPWQEGRTAGGSSGGSAAAVAGGITTLASGGDGGGSIRIPAAFCGLPGMKGTVGRIPRGPQTSIHPMTVVTGVMCRSIRDIARYYDVTSGYDSRDPYSLPKVEGWEHNLGSYHHELRGKKVVITPDLGVAVVNPLLAQMIVEAGQERARAAGEAALARHGSNAELRNQLATIENKLFQARYLAKEPEAAAAAAERSLVHLEAGLQADARHVALLGLYPALVGRVAIARLTTGDGDGGAALLVATCERTDRGDDAREQAALLLSQVGGDLAGRERLLTTAQGVLRERIAARGDVATARARPIQLDGASAASSRLRDFDLRIALGHVAEALRDEPEQDRALQQAGELADSMPGLEVGRLRNLYVQLGEAGIRRGDVGAVAAAARRLLAHTERRTGAQFVAANLLAEALALAETDAAAALRTEAATALARAVADGEVPAAAADQPRFHALRGLPDYDALLQRR